MKDTEVKIKEEGGDSSQGQGMRKGSESGQTEGREQPWRVCDLKRHGSFLPEEDEHLSGLCVLCATWRSCSQASKQTRGSLAATCVRGGWQDSGTDPYNTPTPSFRTGSDKYSFPFSSFQLLVKGASHLPVPSFLEFFHIHFILDWCTLGGKGDVAGR